MFILISILIAMVVGMFGSLIVVGVIGLIYCGLFWLCWTDGESDPEPYIASIAYHLFAHSIAWAVRHPEQWAIVKRFLQELLLRSDLVAR